MVNELKYSWMEDPEILNKRFERHFPLIYIGDEVKVSKRWASSDSKNPDEGRTGKVVEIKHGLQSITSRDYLILKIRKREKTFESWLYTLDLLRRDRMNYERLRSKNLAYIDDRVEITDRSPDNAGITGDITAIFRNDGEIFYSVRSELYSKLQKEHMKEVYKRIEDEIEKRLSDKAEISRRTAEMRRDNPEFVKEIEGELGIPYSTFLIESIKKDVVKEIMSLPEFAKKGREIEKLSQFVVKSSLTKIIEVFPPNKLFRIE